MNLLGFFLFGFVIALVKGQGIDPLVPTTIVNKNGDPPRSISSHIVGGSAASISSFPWQVSLIMTKPFNATAYAYTLCGGTLIHPQWVLTAAHCTINAIVIRVRLGSAIYNSGGVVINSTLPASAGIFTHAGYNSTTLANDVGLVKLATNVTLTANISTIKIASAFGSSLVVSGWGRNCTNCSTMTNLMYTNVKTIPTSPNCTSVYKAGLVTNDTICTVGATGNQSPCYGDSGGPLVQTGTPTLLVGVVSFVSGTGCDNGTYAPAGFMKANNFCTWIKGIFTGYTGC